MNESDAIRVQWGFPDALRTPVASLYDEAFGAKLAIAIRDRDARIKLLADSMWPDGGAVAVRDGVPVGIVGVQVVEGSFTGGLLGAGVDARSILKRLGFFGGIRAAFVFALFRRVAAPGEICMDGIAVASDARGLGIGTRLLDAVIQKAREEGYRTIRLDVIDTNPRARQLYERVGFREVRTERFEWLRWLLGFGASTTMRLEITAAE